MRFGFTSWAAIVAGVLLGGGQLRAQNVELTSNYDVAEAPTQQASAASYLSSGSCTDGSCGSCSSCTGGGSCGNGRCGNCNNADCGGCGGACCLPAFADHCPRFGITSFSGFSSWRGISDAAGPNNNGLITGFNLGAPLPMVNDSGVGFQLGHSSGVYDWMGRPSNGTNEANRAQQQYLFTYGLFRRADADRPLSWGVVHDWMVNDNFGAGSNEPTLSQWRAQVGLALSGVNELGVWAAWRDRGATQTGNSFRAITQTNLFWHRKWDFGGADSWVYFGIPAYGKLGPLGGSIGSFTLGSIFTVPITDHLGVYTNFAYMKASARAGLIGSTEDSYALGAGLTFYPGGTARSRTVAGRSWMPVMPVADNGSFLVDRN